MTAQTNWYVKNFNSSSTFKKIGNKNVIRTFLILDNQSKNDICVFFARNTTEEREFDKFIENGTSLTDSAKKNYYILKAGSSLAADNNLPANAIFVINLTATEDSPLVVVDDII